MDFGYLYKQARIESGLRPDAKARTSSATGLYQFIDQSWLAALKRHGAKHGLQWAADCIAADRRGRLCVTDPGARAEIMNIRNEPEATAMMAAEKAAQKWQHIERVPGRAATAKDLYMGHLLETKGEAAYFGALWASTSHTAASVLLAAGAS